MKQVAESIKSLLDNPLVRQTMNRGSSVEKAVSKVIDFWSYDLYTRKPGPAYKDGIFVGTDLDLSTFLYALVDRGAVIKLPTYKSARPTQIKEGQIISSKENRHGKVLNLVSNQKTFMFSVLVKDMNVMTTDSVGDYRNFAITDLHGDWYDGWRTLEFLPSEKENEFLTENKLYSGNKIVFKNFVHPNRWSSIYGHYYVITKLLISRLAEERKHYMALIKDMESQGIQWPKKGNGVEAHGYQHRRSVQVGDSSKIKISAFEVEVDFPEFNGAYPTIKYSSDELVRLSELSKTYNRALSRLRFATRSTELAYRLYGADKLPSWIKNAGWEDGYTQPGKRTKWDRLVLFQPAVGQLGVSLRKRVYEKTEQVSSSYSA